MVLTLKNNIPCFVLFLTLTVCCINCQNSEEKSEFDLLQLFKALDSKNLTTQNIEREDVEERSQFNQRLCSLGYCNENPTQLYGNTANYVNNQYEQSGFSGSSSPYQVNEPVAVNQGLSKGGGGGFESLTPSVDYLAQAASVPQSASQHIHHHYHHTVNDGESISKNDFDALRNPKKYAFERPPFNGPVYNGPPKRQFPNEQFQRPPISNPNLLGSNIKPNQFNSFGQQAPFKQKPLLTQHQPSVYSQQPFQSTNSIQDFGGGDNCQCVPYHFCSIEDVVGRREDLILPLDPRNLDKDISAAASNDTDIESTTENFSAETTSTTDELKERSKREVDVPPADSEGVS